MTHETFCDLIADATGLTRKDVHAVFRTAAVVVTGQLAAPPRRFRLAGIGVFAVRLCRARFAVNPRTRKPMTVPARRKVVFRASPKLRKAVR